MPHGFVSITINTINKDDLYVDLILQSDTTHLTYGSWVNCGS